ncbi:MAG: ABC transporter ATP-binding protein [Clostridia bacterium BRH_c25]|nr:MAG: ABC transporter ATP-binding protein [Clostridia bacterium BRH_c25]
MNIIETKQLTKCFGGLKANDNIDFHVEAGEIHAIVGENGAGKSTLMNMLFGLLQPTDGELFIRGKRVRIESPKTAIQLGIGMVHQHFKLVPSLTVVENIMLGCEPVRSLFIDRRKQLETVNKLIKDYGFDIDAAAKIRDVSIGVQQRVEILKMLNRDVDILILDEPTAVLTPQECDELMRNMFELKKKGKTIIIITHKLNEVKKCSDSVTVIRQGKVVDRVRTCDVDEKELARMMVGREVLLQVEKGSSNPGDMVYEVNGLCTQDNRGVKVLDHVSLKVCAGEILGIAGVEGNGQSELVRIMAGMMYSTEGKIVLKCKDITNSAPAGIRQQGIGIIPEDRYKHGLCKNMSIAGNIIAGYHEREPYCDKQFLNMKAIKDHAVKAIACFDIRTDSVDKNVGNLSGGNAQKVIIARELSMNPDLLIACQPTRGVDIGSIEFIHKQIIGCRDNGKAVILISSELSEIMSLSDRIAVMYRGRILGEMPRSQATVEKLGLLMAGITENPKGRCKDENYH